MPSTLQDWVMDLPRMQQAVLLVALRGPDGFPKQHDCKPILRWYRRCILVSAFDGIALTDPHAPGGGSFTGPIPPVLVNVDWEVNLKPHLDKFIGGRDEYHLHAYFHLLHAFEIVGYKHPNERIRNWWYHAYVRMVHVLHLYPEGEGALDRRLGDNIEGWLDRSDTSETKIYNELAKSVKGEL